MSSYPIRDTQKANSVFSVFLISFFSLFSISTWHPFFLSLKTKSSWFLTLGKERERERKRERKMETEGEENLLPFIKVAYSIIPFMGSSNIQTHPFSLSPIPYHTLWGNNSSSFHFLKNYSATFGILLTRVHSMNRTGLSIQSKSQLERQTQAKWQNTNSLATYCSSHLT